MIIQNAYKPYTFSSKIHFQISNKSIFTVLKYDSTVELLIRVSTPFPNLQLTTGVYMSVVQAGSIFLKSLVNKFY